MTINLKKLKELAAPYYKNDDPSHDWAHIERVLKLCYRLGETENAKIAIKNYLDSDKNYKKKELEEIQKTEKTSNSSVIRHGKSEGYSSVNFIKLL